MLSFSWSFFCSTKSLCVFKILLTIFSLQKGPTRTRVNSLLFTFRLNSFPLMFKLSRFLFWSNEGNPFYACLPLWCFTETAIVSRNLKCVYSMVCVGSQVFTLLTGNNSVSFVWNCPCASVQLAARVLLCVILKWVWTHTIGGRF